VLGVVIVAGLSGKGSGDASSGSTPATAGASGLPISAGDSTSGSDGNPGAVGVQLTVPGVTQANVVVESTEAPIQKTVFTEPIRFGSYGDEVKQLQQRLTDLHFAPGPVDGAFGEGTQQAVWAYKKLVLGMRWQDLDASDSKSLITPEMWTAMQDPIAIQPRRPQRGGTHVEIYLPLQVLVVFTENQPTLITHIASGNDEEWCDLLSYDTDDQGQPLEEPKVSDECGRSHTPGGVFKFYRRYEGNRVGPLGGMYNPVYFNYGIAVHGAKNVPTHPASHGCIRINMDIAEYFPTLVKNHDLVFVWGQDGKQPEDYTKKERTPFFNWKNPNSTTTSSSSTTSTSVATSTSAGATTTPTTVKPTNTTPPVTTSAPRPTDPPATSPPPATTAAPVVTTSPPPGPTAAPGP